MPIDPIKNPNISFFLNFAANLTIALTLIYNPILTGAFAITIGLTLVTMLMSYLKVSWNFNLKVLPALLILVLIPSRTFLYQNQSFLTTLLPALCLTVCLTMIVITILLLTVNKNLTVVEKVVLILTVIILSVVLYPITPPRPFTQQNLFEMIRMMQMVDAVGVKMPKTIINLTVEMTANLIVGLIEIIILVRLFRRFPPASIIRGQFSKPEEMRKNGNLNRSNSREDSSGKKSIK